MTHDRKPPRQPLFWAALAFSLGLWLGVRAWRPPSWWGIAAGYAELDAVGRVSKRAWVGKPLSLGAWILLGVRPGDVKHHLAERPRILLSRIFALADGRPV